MTLCVLDCSMALSWVLPGEDETDHLLEQIAEHGAVAPALWPLEVGNVLLAAQRRRRISVAERHQALAVLGELRIEIDARTAAAAWGDTLNLAANHNLTVYDASYLEISLRLGLGLASLDQVLLRAARDCGVALLV